MRKLVLAALCYCAAHAAAAAVIRGVVLDRATGRPLARSMVTLRPVDGVGGKPQSVRADRTGQFAFTVNAGMYLLRATRDGFAPFQYGQREWKSAGKPMAVEQDGSLYLNIHLRRYAAISGTVLDENEIGIPDQKVIAYPATLPLRIAATATTDDRGIYRIHGLEPGPYYVRAAAKLLEDGSGLLPTFHKETVAVEQSNTVDADLDQQADEIDIRPFPGKLFRVSGRVFVSPPAPVTLSLISDVGRVQTKTAGAFDFEQVAPGNYEIVAEGDEPYGHGKLATYQEISVDRDREYQIHVTDWRETEFHMQDEKGNRLDPATAKITARRKDLDGGGQPEVLELVNGRAALGPGPWEMSVAPPAGYYPIEVTGSYSAADSQSGRADDWNEVVLRGGDAITIKLSSRPASVHGVVSGPGHDPAPGAPVYLEAFDKDTHKRLGELRSTRTDLRGQYRFKDLAPGLYRILATFEYEKPDSDSMQAAGARSLTLAEATDTTQDLDLYDAT
ncbi:MAG TPA: carboxypeptidase-like regulatory domain-containing protein [Bryobacteraceae bacterium]|nr:carboxypeptidase-like regulatory domain-containing protein [Bryobacteraceae bacterium]